MAVPRSEVEIKALDSFRPLVKDLQFEDGVLMRFLRARDLDMAQTEVMLRKFVEWRVNAKCNQYLGWTIPLDLLQFEIFLTGFDDEDRPVFWAPYGFWPSIRDFMECWGTDDILKHVGKIMNKIYSVLLQTKHQQFVAIVDSEGVTFSKVFYEARYWKGFNVLMGLLHDFEHNFPELLYKATLFNTPLAFMWGWKFLSPCLTAKTHSKIEIYGSGSRAQNQWMAALFDNLPDRCIPTKYGGQSAVINVNEDLLQVWKEHKSSTTT